MAEPSRRSFLGGAGVGPWWAAIAVCGSMMISLRATAPTADTRGALGALGVSVGLLAWFGLKQRAAWHPVWLVVVMVMLVLAARGKVPVLELADPLVWLWLPLTVAALAVTAVSAASASRPGGVGGRLAVTGSTTSRLVSMAAVVGVALLVVGSVPRDVATGAENGGQGGEASEGQGANDPLALQRDLDMTQRPRLTDKVVFSVEADRPSYWRTTTFDVWDGSTWTRSETPITGAARTNGPEEHLGATATSVQRYTLAVDAQALPTAPNVESVDIGGEAVGFVDGRDLFAARRLGPGTSYEVRSTVLAPTLAGVRAAAGPIPPDIARRYGSDPPASDRVRALAANLAQSGDGVWAKVEATERWLANNVEYSLDAPTSPLGSDVVDHFLFDARLGWCEQVASSMVVLLRLQGVPARLATGYVPGERDGLSGGFVVRERDAHAWTEVWVPQTGWVTIDPTAELSLAAASSEPGWLNSVRMVGLVIAGLVVLWMVMPRLWRWAARWWGRLWNRRRSRRTVGPPPTWWARLESDLEELGQVVGAPRRTDESASAHAHRLAVVTSRWDLVEIGSDLDAARYGPASTVESVASRSEQHGRTLAELRAQLADAREPAPT